MKKYGLLFIALMFVQNGFANEKNPFEGFDFGGNKRSITGSSSKLLPMHPRGAVGLFRTFSALQQPASPTSFGIGFMANYYLLKQFPTSDFITERFDGGFFFNYSPMNYIELFGGLSVVTTNNEPPDNILLRQLPNLNFGAKFAYPINNAFHAGLAYHGQMNSSVAEINDSATATNHNIVAVMTYDATETLPMRFHLNGGYQVNNNLRVSQTGADARSINVLKAYSDNAILASLGVEYLVPWALFSLEYSIDMISGGAFADQPQRVSLGARFYPTPDRSFSLTAGSEIGVSGANGTQAGVYVEPNYSFYFGINYLFGLANAQEGGFSSKSSSDFSKQKSKPASQEGSIYGYVNDIETGDPLVGVKVQLCSGSFVVSDQSGRFKTKKLPQGDCALTLEHPKYQTLSDQVTVISNVETPYDFGLLKRTVQIADEPKEEPEEDHTVALTISVKNQQGKPVEAEILFANDRSRTPLQLDASGKGTFEMDPGPYELFARYDGSESVTQYLLLKDEEEKYIEFSLSQKQKVQISKDKKKINIAETVQFEVGKALLTFNSKKLIEEIAHLLKAHPEITLLEIAGHTDHEGDATLNLELSQERADAVQTVLVENGIEGQRLRSVGYGEDFPIASNDTEEGRYQNRRVEFRILKRDEP